MITVSTSKKDAALELVSNQYWLEEPTVEETKAIYVVSKSGYEEHHKLTISDEAWLLLLHYRSGISRTGPLPDKAIDLVDEARIRG